MLCVYIWKIAARCLVSWRAAIAHSEGAKDQNSIVESSINSPSDFLWRHILMHLVKFIRRSYVEIVGPVCPLRISQWTISQYKPKPLKIKGCIILAIKTLSIKVISKCVFSCFLHRAMDFFTFMDFFCRNETGAWGFDGWCEENCQSSTSQIKR